MSFEESDIICNYLKNVIDKGIMFDAGAHYGYVLKSFLDIGWKVFAFEPNQDALVFLNKLKTNNSNLLVDSRALSDKIESNVPFYTSKVSTGISALSKFHDSHIESAKINTITIEQYCKKNSINKIDFLKIDVEGYELFVLKGVPWEDLKPEIILCEFEDRKTKPLGYSFFDMADFLVEKGYKLIISEWFPIIEYGTPHSWNCFKEYPCKLDTEDAWGNIIAFKSEINYFDFLNSVAQLSSNIIQENQRQLQTIINSRSWALTKPVRVISRIINKCFTPGMR